MKYLIAILITLISFPVFSQLYQQNENSTASTGNVQVMNGGLVAVSGQTIDKYDVWKSTVINSYLANNPHFSASYIQDLRDYLNVILDKDYEMSNDSLNYCDVYGPDGLNKSTAEWFFALRFVGNVSQVAVYITKTGQTLTWNCDGSLYYSNNTPTHSLGTGDGWALVTSRDGFNLITYLYLGSSYWSGELPYIGTRATRTYINSCDFFGQFPNITNPSCQYYVLSTNFFTKIGTITGLLNDTFAKFTAQYNSFDQASVDKIFADLLAYYSQAGKIKVNVEIDLRYGSNAHPSSTGLANISTLQSLFTAASKTFTAYVN